MIATGNSQGIEEEQARDVVDPSNGRYKDYLKAWFHTYPYLHVYHVYTPFLSFFLLFLQSSNLVGYVFENNILRAIEDSTYIKTGTGSNWLMLC